MNEDKKDNKEKIRIKLAYEDLEVELEGEYDKIWKSVNKFFKKIQKEMGSEKASAINTKGKETSEIIESLLRNQFFENPKDSKDVHRKFKELGRTKRLKKR